jgi:hypothetical protein
MQNRRKQTLRAVVLGLTMLTLTGLACNLTRESDEQTPAAISNLPAVTVLSPAANAAAPVGAPFTVQVSATDSGGSGVTKVELLANNIIVDQKPSQAPTGDREMTVNLTWNAPAVPGNILLVVRPWRGLTQGTPATLPVIVVDSSVAPTVTLGPAPGNFTAVAPTFNPVCRARVDAQGLRLRSTPDTTRTDNIIDDFDLGDEPPVLGRLADNSWYQVRALAGVNVGWVSGAYVTLLGSCNIPVISPPATPVPTPTNTLIPAAEPPPADLVALNPSGLATVELGAENTATAIYVLVIRNGGGRESGPFKVQIVLPGGQQLIESVTTLAPGATVSVPVNNLTVTFNAPGPQRVLYQADFENVVTESDEGNNIAWLDVNVVAPPAP